MLDINLHTFGGVLLTSTVQYTKALLSKVPAEYRSVPTYLYYQVCKSQLQAMNIAGEFIAMCTSFSTPHCRFMESARLISGDSRNSSGMVPHAITGRWPALTTQFGFLVRHMHLTNSPLLGLFIDTQSLRTHYKECTLTSCA